MSLHREIHFEEPIYHYLGAHGWMYVEGDAARYDRARALFPDDVLDWVQATQPDAWGTLTKDHGPATRIALLDRLHKQIPDAEISR